MTKEQTIDAEFQRYIDAYMPEMLTADTSSHGVAARLSWVGQRRCWWLEKIAAGFRASELLGDEEMPETTLGGRPKRKLISEVPAALEAQGYEVARALAEKNIHIDPILESCLGTPLDSPPEKLVAAIDAGLAAIRTHDAQVRNAKAEREAQHTVRIIVPFTGRGGKQWTVGECQLSDAEMDDLSDWANEHESRAAKKGWPSPSGFIEWPPYVVVR